MSWISRVYSLILKLYPPAFRYRFGAEMEDVFCTGLAASRKQGGVFSFVMRELTRLPSSLVGVYLWSMHEAEGRRVAVSNVGSAGTSAVHLPSEGWGSSLLSGLPHLLTGIVIISSAIAESGILTSLDLQAAIFAVILIGVVIYNIVKGWKRWSASWIFYMFFIALIGLGRLMSLFFVSVNEENYELYNLAQILLIPLLLAYFLYKIACKDRLRGLLAAIPLMAVVWTYFLEFVPALPRSLAWGWIFLLAFIASVLILHTKNFVSALGLAMAVPLIGGFPFAYLGVFQGGTLPFSEPGPSLVEAFRQYLPFLVSVLALVLGPQLAVKVRAVGYDSGKFGGKLYYRLALGGILLGFVWSLLNWVSFSSESHIAGSILQVIFISAIVLFIIGFILLTRATYRNKSLSGNNNQLLELGALFLPVLFIPATIFLVFPTAIRHEPSSWLVALVEFAWVIASILVVKD